MFDPLPFIETKKIANLEEFFLFAYTDGLTETFNESEEDFGFERLENIIKQDCPSDLSELHDQILKTLDEFKGERSFLDDITMLSCLVQNR